MNKNKVSRKQKSKHIKYWYMLFGILFLLGAYMAYVNKNSTINTWGILIMLTSYIYVHLSWIGKFKTIATSKAKSKFIDMLSICGFLILALIPKIWIDSQKPGHLLKYENFISTSLDPYPYESALPPKLKRFVVLTNGKLSLTEEFRNGKKVFSNYINKHDSTQTTILAYLLNNSDEVLKTYRLDNSSISIDTFFSYSHHEVIQQNRFYIKDVTNSTLSDIKGLSYEELIQEKWLNPFKDSLKQGIKIVYETNSKGQKINETTFNANGDTTNVTDFNYNKEGQIQTCYSRSIDGNTNNRLSYKYAQNIYYEGTSQNKLSAYTWEQMYESGMSRYSLNYIHNKEGLLTQVILNQNKVETKTIYEYDTKGRLITETSLGADGITIDQITRYLYTPTSFIDKKRTEGPKGNIIEEETYEFSFE